MRYWLIKSEPTTYGIDHIARDKTTAWTGVRNFQARNFMRDQMKVGDRAFFYHSNCEEPGIVGIGIGRKFQKPTVFEQLTVFENLELALAGDRSFLKTLRARLTTAHRERIDEVLQIIGLMEQRTSPGRILAHGQKQWLEIGMLLMQNPELLLVDEPVAGMTPHEIERTAELLTSLAGEHSIVVVEHDMSFVRSIAKRVNVLHEGHVIAEGDMDAVQNDPRVIEVYLGV